MSKKIVITFVCAACQAKSKVAVIKPTPGTPRTQHAECESCYSKHLLRVDKAKGGGHTEFLYSVIDVEVSAQGLAKHNALNVKSVDAALAALPEKVDREIVNDVPKEINL